jgi:hypothetical protein
MRLPMKKSSFVAALGLGVALALFGATTLTRAQPNFTPPKPTPIAPPTQSTITQGVFVTQADHVLVGGASSVNVAQLWLKPGQYILSAKLVGTNAGGTQTALACGLTTSNPWAASETGDPDYSSVTIAPDSRLPMALQGSGVFKATTALGTPLYLACRAQPGSTVTVRWAKLMATAVPRVN